MLSWSPPLARAFFLVIVFVLIPSLRSSPPPSWSGVLREAAGNPLHMAAIELFAPESNREYSTTTSATGQFVFAGIAPGNYTLTVSAAGKIWTAADPVVFKDGAILRSSLQLSLQGQEHRIMVAQDAASPQASGGEHLSTGEVSSLPLNEHDFSKLLLLAAGTMTDANGAANFTHQFPINRHTPSAAFFSLPLSHHTPPTL